MNIKLRILAAYGLMLWATNTAYSQGTNPKVCGRNTLSQAKEDVNRLTGSLRIAAFRGDISEMTNRAREIEGILDQCQGKPSSPQDFSCMNPSSPAPSSSALSPVDAQVLVANVCDHECHYQLARYHLFMSGDFLYLSNKGLSGQPDLGTLLNRAKKHSDLCGQPIVDRGLANLMRNGPTDLSAEPTDPDSPALENYLRKNFALSRLKIQLLLTSGDLNYQASSDLEAKKIFRLASRVTSGPDADPMPMDNTLKSAMGLYEKARWAGVMLRTEIPNSQRYADLQVVSSELDRQARIRIESLERGRLFLNIDPEQFSTLSASKLRERLNSLNGRVKALESEISNLFRRGADDKLAEQQGGIDEGRTVNSMSVNLASQKLLEYQEKIDSKKTELQSEIDGMQSSIAGIRLDFFRTETDASKIQKNIAALQSAVGAIESRIAGLELEKANAGVSISDFRKGMVTLEQEQAKLALDTETLQYNIQARQIEFDINRRLIELQKQKQRIDTLEYGDLIGLKREKLREDQARYQWLVSVELTNLNLDLQIKEIGSRLQNLGNDVRGSIASANQLEIEYKDAEAEYRGINAELDSLQESIKLSLYRKYFGLVKERQDRRRRVCEIEQSLAYAGIKPGNGTVNGSVPSFKAFDPSDVPLAFVGQSDDVQFKPNRTEPEYLAGGSGSFAYRLFEKAQATCPIETRDSLFLAGNVTFGDSPSSDSTIFNISEDDLPTFASWKKEDKNPLADLPKASLKVVQGLYGSSTLESVFDETNAPCDLKIPKYTALDYHSAVCGADDKSGLRSKMNEFNISLEKFETCRVIALNNLSPQDSNYITCKDFIDKGFNQSDLDFLVSVNDKNKDILLARHRGLIDAIKQTENYLDIMIAETDRYKVELVAAGEFLSAAALIRNKTAGTEISTSTGVCGQGPCAVTTTYVKSTEIAKAIWESALALKDYYLKNRAIDYEQIPKYESIRNEIRALRRELEENELEQQLSLIAFEQSKNEIKGRAVSSFIKTSLAETQRDLTIADCGRDANSWLSGVDSSIAEHARLIDSLKAQPMEARSIDTEMNRDIARSQMLVANRERVRLKVEGLKEKLAQVKNNIKNSMALIENNTEQMCRIEQTRTSIETLNGNIGTTFDDIKKIDILREKNVLALNDIERSKIEDLLKLEKGGEDCAALDYSQMTPEKQKECGAYYVLLAQNREGVRLANLSSQKTSEKLALEQQIRNLEGLIAISNKEIETSNVLTKDQQQAMLKLKEQVADLESKKASLSVSEQEQAVAIVEINKAQTNLTKELQAATQKARSEIVQAADKILAETDGKKKLALLSSQEEVEAVNAGLLDYVGMKKTLMEEANFYLNLLRSRLNMGVSLTAAPQLEKLAYVRTSWDLESSLAGIDRSLVELGVDETITGSQPVIFTKGNTSVIDITPDSGFMRELLSKGRVAFEVAPLPGRTKEAIDAEMKARGFFTLWSDDFRYANARLIDIQATVSADCALTSNLNIVHAGSGYVFKANNPSSSTSTYEPVLHSASPRVSGGKLVYYDKSPVAESLRNDFDAFLSNGRSLTSFDSMLESMQDRPNSPISGLLIGYPVMGVYEARLDVNSACVQAYKSTTFKLRFNITRDRMPADGI